MDTDLPGWRFSVGDIRQDRIDQTDAMGNSELADFLTPGPRPNLAA